MVVVIFYIRLKDQYESVEYNMSYKTYWHFTDTAMKYDCHDYVDKIWNQFGNVYRMYQYNLINNIPRSDCFDHIVQIWNQSKYNMEIARQIRIH